MSEAEVQSVLDGRINYAQCWEDIVVLRSALQIKNNERVLSICSAGDNSFALALDGASEVVCIDISAPQLALAELKWLALQEWGQEGLHTLLGLNDAGRRVYLYHQIRSKCSENTRIWWDHNEEMIREGILNAGRFEKYLTMFGEKVLPLIHRKKTIATLASLRSLEEQRAFYDKRWNNLRWKGLFRIFFSQTMMAKMGRSPEQFRYAEESIAEMVLGRTKHALTEIPIASNPYLQWILTGKYTNISDSHPYLNQESIQYLQEKQPKLTFVHSGIVEYLESCPDDSFDAFNFSNIFEYLSVEECEQIFELVYRKAKDGARLAYWNLMVPRARPESMKDKFFPQTERAKALHLQDRAFFYSQFHLDIVDKSA